MGSPAFRRSGSTGLPGRTGSKTRRGGWPSSPPDRVGTALKRELSRSISGFFWFGKGRRCRSPRTRTGHPQQTRTVCGQDRRDHRHIENRVHFARNFICDEDRCRVYVRDLPPNPACPTNTATSTIRCRPGPATCGRPTALLEPQGRGSRPAADPAWIVMQRTRQRVEQCLARRQVPLCPPWPLPRPCCSGSRLNTSLPCNLSPNRPLYKSCER